MGKTKGGEKKAGLVAARNVGGRGGRDLTVGDKPRETVRKGGGPAGFLTMHHQKKKEEKGGLGPLRKTRLSPLPQSPMTTKKKRKGRKLLLPVTSRREEENAP